MTLADLLGIHNYLNSVPNPSPKIQEALARIETIINDALSQLTFTIKINQGLNS